MDEIFASVFLSAAERMTAAASAEEHVENIERIRAVKAAACARAFFHSLFANLIVQSSFLFVR